MDHEQQINASNISYKSSSYVSLIIHIYQGKIQTIYSQDKYLTDLLSAKDNIEIMIISNKYCHAGHDHMHGNTFPSPTPLG
ncbi:hypothetical protein RCL_jg6664.t1 [Rhizophagus clarus]|uniref:Uncharacterized protein n=1 Tax=Rhizophagus clarus TaxID=94130 RepID=A0A8H3LGZ5_9GLOM|nr:hypothetical protein RCL_jg6664.t1 [Rhizophagus clarus]